MPIRARETVDIPDVSVPTFLFGSPGQPLPNVPIIIDPASPETKYLTLSTYCQWSQRFAHGLREAGFQNGDRLLLVAGNSLAYPVVLMGTLMAGGILTGVSPALGADELVLRVKDLEPSFILATQEGYATSLQVASTTQLPLDRIYLFDPEIIHDQSREHENGWQKLLASEPMTFDWTSQAQSKDTAVINFTSGSTGHAKGVIVSHRNLVANAVQYIERQKQNPVAAENGGEGNRVMWTPMYHVLGETQICIISPKRGIRSYVMETFDLELLLKYTEQFRPTDMLLLPTVVITMLSHPLTRKYDLSSVRVILSGGSPLRDSIISKFKSVMPNPLLEIRQGWGMTEITCVATEGVSGDSANHSVGRLLPNCEARIMTPDGQTELGPDEPGEVWIHSPNVTQGYLKRPELDAATFFPGGWLRTGDFGSFDTDQRLYIRDRIQDLIHSPDGAYALPTDLESVLLNIPGVRDAGITSIPLDESSSYQVPRAFVVLDQTIEKDVKGVQAQFDVKVKPHEQLKGGIYEIKEIPRLPSGKVHRNALRQLHID